ncbi:MAG: hypothetical protein IKD69_07205 [Solobacterium sp.]|nr:hypothetical protein [Solobacterium sp.]
MKRFQICATMMLGLLLFVPWHVHAEETQLTEEDLAEISGRLEQALDEGLMQADLSDLGIIVNMYNDRFSEQYQKVLDVCDVSTKEYGSFILGSHKEPYVYLSPEIEPTDEADEYGIGPNRLNSITVIYDPYYRNPDGSADLEALAETQETLDREYACAMAVVSDEMTDVEKALALYDYIISVSNYPDEESINEEGIAVYDDESYSTLSVFRDHISVCCANATAYCYLLSDCGIDCARVDSDAMKHAWTMLKVDGDWYHADPTWDNARYMYGYTSLGDRNDDSWDLGAAAHEYFLKSDEEMVNSLQHYGWFVMLPFSPELTSKEAPASGPSGHFDDTFFGRNRLWPNDTHYNYVNGNWYFPDRYANKIVKIAYGQDMETAEYIDAPTESLMKYVFSADDCLFICENDGIWRYDTRNGQTEKLPLQEGALFTEMNIASGRLNAVLYENPADDSDSLTVSIPLEELPPMEVIPVTQEPAPATETPRPQETPQPTAEPAGSKGTLSSLLLALAAVFLIAGAVISIRKKHTT